MKKININDYLYPNKLKNIPNPPQNIYVEGNLDLFNSKTIAIIGSRRASDSGKLLAEKFTTELSKTGITIISGLAIGIDTVAHTFSYDQKGKTIAVLGCGFNKIFPKENTTLYQNILSNNGLIISEYPPDTEYKSEYFPMRNRLISGLSLGILVIEAKFRSGTSITANHALLQKKPIFTIPHEIWATNGTGTNNLIKKGAILITDTSEILNYLKLYEYKKTYSKLKQDKVFNKFSKKYLNRFMENSSKKYIKSSEKNSIKNSFNNSIQITKNESIISLKNKESEELNISNNIEQKNMKDFSTKNLSNPKSKKIFQVIKTSSNFSVISPNEISLKTNIPINETLSILFILELDGYIKKSAGGYTCI